MKLRIYFNRTDIENGVSTPIDFPPPVTPANAHFHLNKYSGSGLSAFGFAEGLIPDDGKPDDDTHVTVLVNMLIPYYFEHIDGGTNNEDVHGLFLVQIGLRPIAKKFLRDLLQLGRFGCPKRIIMTRTGTNDHFKFNRMRFYPFLMPDFSVGYYVCDESSTDLHWPPFKEDERGVALDYPLTYDPTLGLYITRAAHIEG